MIVPLTFHLAVIGPDALLEQELRRYALPDGVTVNTVTCHSCADQGAEQADLLIFDGIPDALAELTPERFGKSMGRVLYATPEELGALAAEHTRRFFTAFWAKPAEPAVLGLWLWQLLEQAEREQERQMSRIYLNTLIDSVPDLIWFKDLRGSHLKVNEAFCRAVGKTKQQCEGRGHYYIWDLDPDEYAGGEYVCLETEEEVIRQGKTCLFDEKVLSKNGLRQFKTYKSPLFDPAGEMFGTVGIAKDVTDLENIGQELELILAGLPFGTLIADEKGHIVSVNSKFCDYFGLMKDEVETTAYTTLCRNILDMTPEFLNRRDMVEVTVITNEEPHVFQVRQQPIYDIFDNHFGTFLLCLDVTNEYELKQKILHSANTDFLTGLYNRRFFYDAVRRRSRSCTISLAYFDLDDFKLVNDTFGHQAGDRALTTMAELLREEFPDALITRLGGDEFVVALFNSCEMDAFRDWVNRFIQRVNEAYRADMEFGAITVSAGITYEQIGSDVDMLISHADQALYLAKSLGKSRCCVYEKQ